MGKYCFLFLFIMNGSVSAKEWKSLKVYQNTTQQEKLLPSDWLKSDRIHNTIVWQNANKYNLNEGLYQEYTTIVGRRDFYKWLSSELNRQGHEVVWVSMSFFISKKIHKMEAFPFVIGFSKKTLQYVREGSEAVFNNAFKDLNYIFNSDEILRESKALTWDKEVLLKEQYDWIDGIYKKMNSKSLKIFEHIAKGKFPFSLVVPKKIRFDGDITNPEARYHYALHALRPYCENTVK